MSECTIPILPKISTASGVISFSTSLISLLPQLIETYQDKSVEGLSPYLLSSWLLGDLTTLLGTILTGQLKFQIILALYYTLNDLILCGEYYYYGVIHQNRLAVPGHESKSFEDRLRLTTALSRQQTATSSPGKQSPISTPPPPTPPPPPLHSSSAYKSKASWLYTLFHLSPAQALHILSKTVDGIPNSPTVPLPNPTTGTIGVLSSWIGGFLYVGGRLPQLIKNYRRKSTDGLSPFLFGCTLVSNFNYGLSVLTSCEFLTSPNKHEYLMVSLPFLIGSVGTILFDFIYFYQHYVLYYDDAKLRQLEAQLEAEVTANEITPLLH
ncbi:Ypq2p Ecym_5507 [Eremothecium cymbalariae DBVPG|uniref:Uncharacterized protein n=1 Tax=Eremothecium cymbalariae (strain CBS 270.75 / DBVPG 7215 / KCTC 17166 / NRRL Y-17582) TaxID=931890 RepID=I6NDV8_ERECY|nr:hypothetical protein Ecym_5507 [Eremothecium cymbalariae DBVPG\